MIYLILSTWFKNTHAQKKSVGTSEQMCNNSVNSKNGCYFQAFTSFIVITTLVFMTLTAVAASICWLWAMLSWLSHFHPTDRKKKKCLSVTGVLWVKQGRGMIVVYDTLLSTCSSWWPYAHGSYKALYKSTVPCHVWPSLTGTSQ